jgi:hypothetical protein
MKYILNNNYEYEFYEIHSVSQLIKFIEELKARNGERLEPEKLNLGGRRTKKKKKRK